MLSWTMAEHSQQHSLRRSSVQARAVVVDIIQTYLEHQVEILVEAPGVRAEKDVVLLGSLIQEAQSNSFADARKSSSEDMSSASMSMEASSDTVSAFRRAHAAVDQSALQRPAILLFGSHDLRLVDNEAVLKACCHTKVLPVFLWD